jgi:FtsP/CotA-like multicopper oxidase with cupredoxin domain
MRPLSRRRALQLGVVGAASTIVGAVGLTRRLGSTPFQATVGESLVEPPTLRSTGGELSVRLEVAERTVHLAGRRATVLNYNGSLPGPTLYLQPGDRLRIQLINLLDEATNLHVHGLHVSPVGNGDNVFVHIDPGTSYDYDYQLPDDHPPGVFWYHPHLHGTVADQIFGGLYGAIIVGDPTATGADPMPTTRERVLVISDISLDSAGRIRGPATMDRMMGREGDLLLVNGQDQPLLTARPGERERWRIVNTCTSRYLMLRLPHQHMQLLGIDSGHLATPRDVEEVVLAPGNRADLLIMASAGTSQLETARFDRGSMMGMMGGPGNGSMPGRGNPEGSPARADLVPIARFEVTGNPAHPHPSITRQTTPRDLRNAPIAARRQLRFAMTMGGGQARFTIDGQEFDPDRVDQTAKAGTVEEWTITNTSPMDHPLHLHVWPMQLIEQGGTPLDYPAWQDVVNIPARSHIKVRINFDHFTGRTVYHCHILDHEDNGMMGVINVE